MPAEQLHQHFVYDSVKGLDLAGLDEVRFPPRADLGVAVADVEEVDGFLRAVLVGEDVPGEVALDAALVEFHCDFKELSILKWACDESSVTTSHLFLCLQTR